MTNTEKVLEEKELSKLVIDLVWSATDGGCKLKESDFSHFEEPLYEWTALVNKFSTSIHQAIAEDRERVRAVIENTFTVYFRSIYSQDCSRNETKEEKSTEMIKLSDVLAILASFQDNPKE